MQEESIMKIWFVNHYAVPPVEAGGTRHYSFAKELINRGHQVRIIAANFNHQTRKPILNNSDQRILNTEHDMVPFSFIKVPAYTGNSPARLINMLSFSRQLLYIDECENFQTPDIIIGSSPHPFAAWAAQKLASRWQIPFILEIRDLWPQSLIDLGRISPRHPAVWFMTRLERYLYNKADKIITLLPGAHDYIESIGIDSDKVVWIPNGIDFSLFNQPLVEPNNNEVFTVMYAGAHGLANGLDIIVKCAEIVNRNYAGKVIFRLVGEGPEKKRLKTMANKMGLTNISFEDPVPKQQVPQLLSQADAFIMLLKDSPVFRWGISPNKLYDYLSSGRPVIFGIRAYNNPVEEAGAGITVPPENPEKLAEAIIQLYNMGWEKRKEIGLNGRKYVEENHDFKDLVIKLEKILFESIRKI